MKTIQNANCIIRKRHSLLIRNVFTFNHICSGLVSIPMDGVTSKRYHMVTLEAIGIRFNDPSSGYSLRREK